MSEEVNLGAAIKAKRDREGLSLRDAAGASGIAFSTLGRIENGGNASLKVDRLARSWLNGETLMLPLPAMTLRDWFAGQALTGMLTCPLDWTRWVRKDGNGTTWQMEAAADAYKLADAMTAARLALLPANQGGDK